MENTKFFTVEYLKNYEKQIRQLPLDELYEIMDIIRKDESSERRKIVERRIRELDENDADLLLEKESRKKNAAEAKKKAAEEKKRKAEEKKREAEERKREAAERKRAAKEKRRREEDWDDEEDEKPRRKSSKWDDDDDWRDDVEEDESDRKSDDWDEDDLDEKSERSGESDEDDIEEDAEGQEESLEDENLEQDAEDPQDYSEEESDADQELEQESSDVEVQDDAEEYGRIVKSRRNHVEESDEEAEDSEDWPAESESENRELEKRLQNAEESVFDAKAVQDDAESETVETLDESEKDLHEQLEETQTEDVSDASENASAEEPVAETPDAENEIVEEAKAAVEETPALDEKPEDETSKVRPKEKLEEKPLHDVKDLFADLRTNEPAHTSEYKHHHHKTSLFSRFSHSNSASKYELHCHGSHRKLPDIKGFVLYLFFYAFVFPLLFSCAVLGVIKSGLVEFTSFRDILVVAPFAIAGISFVYLVIWKILLKRERDFNSFSAYWMRRMRLASSIAAYIVIQSAVAFVTKQYSGVFYTMTGKMAMGFAAATLALSFVYILNMFFPISRKFRPRTGLFLLFAVLLAEEVLKLLVTLSIIK